MTYVNYTGNGVNTVFAVTFDYISESDIKVSINGVDTSYTLVGSDVILAVAPDVNAIVKVYRDTPVTGKVTFSNNSVITAGQLETSFKQARYMAEESKDEFDVLPDTSAMVLQADLSGYVGLSGDNFDAQGKRIENMADPAASGDAVTKAYVDSLSTYGAAGEAQSVTITAGGGSNNFTLDNMAHAVAQSLVVSLDGVVLAPETDFSVVGGDNSSQLLLTSTPTAGQKLVVQNFGTKKFIPALALEDRTISTSLIETDAITADQLADDSVTQASLANASVGSNQLAGASVTSAALATDAVTSDALADDAVVEGAIADGSITSSKLKTSGFHGSPDATYPKALLVDTSGNLDIRTLELGDLSNIVGILETLTVSFWGAAGRDVNMGENGGPYYNIKNMADPEDNQDAATKNYVDGLLDDVLANYQAVGTSSVELALPANTNCYELTLDGVSGIDTIEFGFDLQDPSGGSVTSSLELSSEIGLYAQGSLKVLQRANERACIFGTLIGNSVLDLRKTSDTFGISADSKTVILKGSNITGFIKVTK